MVNWLLKVINKYGKVMVTVVVTLIVASISVTIAVIDMLVFGHNLFPALYLSAFIPILIAPPTLYFPMSLVVKLDRTEKELETVIEGAGDALFLNDRSGKILKVNEAACQSLGYTREELMAMNVSDIQVRHSSKVLTSHWDDVALGKAATLAGEHRRKDGSTFPVEARVSALEYGDDISFLAVIRDVSERQRIHASLLESEERFRKSFENAAIGMTVTELDGKFRSVNSAWCKMIGYSEQEILSKTVAEVTFPDDIIRTTEDRQNLADGSANISLVEKRYVHKDGHIVWGFMSRAVVRGAEGEPLYFIGQIQDISERKDVELKLLDSEEKYRKLVETSHDLIWSVDNSGIFTFVNEASKLTHGYEPEEMIGQPFTNFMTAEQAEKDMAVFAKIKEGISYFDLESVHLKKDGSPVYLSFNAVVERDDQGNILGTTGSAKDITNRVLTEEQSRLHQEQLAHVSRVATMGEMATGIAHELNQPLAAIAAYIDGSLRRLNSDGQTSKPIIEALEKASDQAIRAGDVIKRLRDFVRREDSKLEDIDINDTVHTALQLLKSDFDLNRVALKFDLAQDRPIIYGDPILIQQVILNLARNSVDAMNSLESGLGKLKVNTVTEDHSVLIGISDNGPGIDLQLQEKLFEPYVSTKKSGLGLGLPICRSIINEFGGEIWFEPAPANGAVFQIRLPLHR
ncbi:MAG: PAS domain S-box protein [Rhodospirillaceae bacterium]|nr:PAS domain S-box protein [Rhodospirillaceae bacterium]MBT7953632.1 PAS domain S-box protein [Rhodospirillaceae bacterium]